MVHRDVKVKDPLYPGPCASSVLTSPVFLSLFPTSSCELPPPPGRFLFLAAARTVCSVKNIIRFIGHLPQPDNIILDGETIRLVDFGGVQARITCPSTPTAPCPAISTTPASPCQASFLSTSRPMALRHWHPLQHMQRTPFRPLCRFTQLYFSPLLFSPLPPPNPIEAPDPRGLAPLSLRCRFPFNLQEASLWGDGMPLGSTIVGTYGYMAPEQFRGAAQPSSDLYALGGEASPPSLSSRIATSRSFRALVALCCLPTLGTAPLPCLPPPPPPPPPCAGSLKMGSLNSPFLANGPQGPFCFFSAGFLPAHFHRKGFASTLRAASRRGKR